MYRDIETNASITARKSKTRDMVVIETETEIEIIILRLTPTDARAFAADVLAAAGGATMTAREAAERFFAEWQTDKRLFPAFARDWFAAHWPAATVKESLPVAPAFDVEAVAREISDSVRHWYASTEEHELERTRDDVIAAILRRHARAVPAEAPQWITRPAPQPSALVVPEDGQYALRRESGSVDIETCYLAAASGVPWGDITAIRRIDTDAPTTWIYRTPATAGGWSPGCIPDGDVMAYLPPSSLYMPTGAVYAFHRRVCREKISERLNVLKAERIYVIPIAPERGA